MTRRRGLSVTEVLVALFILALGIIALQTMFPIAAMQMGVAVREDRSALSAFTGDAYLRSYWKSEVTEKGGSNEAFFTALDNPDPTGSRGLQNAALDPVSYPVIVDPMGWVARSGAGQAWFGDGGGTNIPRTTLLSVLNSGNPSKYSLRNFSLIDGQGFDEFGVPTPDREFRYNWLYIVQRMNNSNKLAANVTMVVFDKRTHLFAPAGSEPVYTTVSPMVPGTTSLSVYGSPDLRAGAWIMDATVQGTPGGIRHANMYRVSRVQDNVTSMDIELETPIKRTDGGSAPYNGTIVVLRGVSGVYVRTPVGMD